MSAGRLEGQRVAVFGGSLGIGLAVARASLVAGAEVTILGRDRGRLDVAATALGAVRSHVVDIADDASVEAAAKAIPVPDHVYVAAGSFVGGGVLDGDLDDFRAAFETRLWGALRVVRGLAPRMPAGGGFVFTGGLSTDRPVPGAWATALATAVAEQMARALALELAPLRCNAIAPGWTDTPMWDPILGDAKAATFEAVAARIPTRRLATADEAAEAVLLLMANRSINGEVLHVDGGHRLA
ncbi:MAG: SDR family oxidoreductase [Lysobacteraceae bacterium]